jgi:peptidoglycan hydrolase-like protein with peptidoglycan-binding domain
MAQAADPFLVFQDDVAWWDEPDEPPAAAVAAPAPFRPRPRRRQRTLAGDLARLRAGLGGSRLRAVALPGLLAAVALVVAARLALGGDEHPAPTAPPAARSQAVEAPAPARESPPRFGVLRPDDRGPGVRDLQAALGALGVYDQPPDAAFGPATTQAVAAFQQEHGLDIDGIAGPTTLTSIVDAVTDQAALDAAEAEAGLAEAVSAGRLSPEAASRYRSVVTDSLAALRVLQPGRSATVGLVLANVAAHADSYDEPRALALFGMLAANARYLADHPLPAARHDIEDEEGVVYRYFAAYGFQFHPLANFARLNSRVREGDREAARAHARALVARAVSADGVAAWEYYFPYGGPDRWTSGFAQAVAAQALARSGAWLNDASLLEQAGAAYRAVPNGLSRDLGGGSWVREYGFADTAILNAQLQSIVSLSEYVGITHDERARATVESMTTAAAALLPEFDTGCWSRYSLDGAPASTTYHTYHVRLLQALARVTEKTLWSEAATRWDGYLRAGACTTT